MKIKLRPYQAEVLDIIDSLENGRYLIQMATGLGKTATFTNIKRKRKSVSLSAQRRTNYTASKIL